MAERATVYLHKGNYLSARKDLSWINHQMITILDSIFDGVYITDGSTNTLMVNQAYLAISGLSKEQVLGKSMPDLVNAGIVNRSGTLAALKARKTVTLDQTFHTGKQVLITSTPCFEEDGSIFLVITVVRDMTELYNLQEKNRENEERYRREVNLHQALLSRKFIVVDPKTQEVLTRAERVASLNTIVLLLGETGVGKEQFARFIFENSPRKNQTFISVNCGAIPSSLIESELFGYERGAFTGANKEGKLGIFEAANHGTVFLDEIGDLPMDMQVHLLRVLQEMRVKRIGSVKSIPVDVRIIAATNRDLWEMVQAKTFREDLYYRLNVVPITIPPLRERHGDIIPMVQGFLSDMNEKYHVQKNYIPTALKAMQDYQWPGNVRELKNVVEQSVIFSAGEYILPSDLPISISNKSSDSDQSAKTGNPARISIDLKRAVAKFEYGFIKQSYEMHGNVRDAAASLGMDPSTFVRKRKRWEKLLQK
ncbi:sigma 54-interacting transcriptional regulator [Oscillibacter sp.]|uniref:sigma-54 interaction domain-containing protein n=1 Tax=Oscillibacter sp. TaxID=1945593 RepID=UPI0028B03646|nr:sigma 54-interacting transcriptional regulator [Oscillibacter sp.]